MLYPRHFWYTFFSELGFLIMPCGFKWHSTTHWLFEGEPEDETGLSSEHFTIAYMGMDCFFYRLNAALLRQHLALFRFTDTLIRHKLSRENIVLDIPSAYHEHPLPNVGRYEGKKVLQGFSLSEYMVMLSAITDQIDPMDWKKDAQLIPDYLDDFDTYGFCFLAVSKRGSLDKP
jgi:hypothetical protein